MEQRYEMVQAQLLLKRKHPPNLWFNVVRSWHSYNRRRTSLRNIELSCGHVIVFYWNISSSHPTRRKCEPCRQRHADREREPQPRECGCGRCLGFK